MEIAFANELTGFLVEELSVLAVDLDGFDGHGAIEKDGDGRDGPIADELGEVIEDLLGTADGEGGDEDAFAGVDGIFEDFEEFDEGLIERAVVAVAVGGFEEDEVGGGKRSGVAEHGSVEGAYIAGKDDDFFGGLPVGDGHLDAGGAEHVAGVDETNRDAVGDVAALAVIDGLEAGVDCFGVGRGVERFDFGLTLADAASVEAFGILLLDMSGVEEDQFGEVGGGGGRVNGTAKAAAGEDGEASAVIEVGVGKDNGVEAFGIDGLDGAVLGVGGPSALEETEIHQDAGRAGFDEIGGACDFAGRAAEGDFHGVRGEGSARCKGWLADNADGERKLKSRGWMFDSRQMEVGEPGGCANGGDPGGRP